MLPHDFTRWEAVYQQTQRWLRTGCLEAIAHNLRLLLRLAAGRTMQSTPKSGAGSKQEPKRGFVLLPRR